MHIKHSLYKCMTLRIHVISYLLFNVFWCLHSNFATGRSQFNWKHGMKLKYKMGCHLESSTWLLQHATDKQCGSSAMGWAPNRNLTSQCQILHPKHAAKAHYQIPNQHVVWEMNWDSIAELTAAWIVNVQHAKGISNQIQKMVCRTCLPSLTSLQ